MKKFGKIAIGLVVAGLGAALVFSRITRKEPAMEAVPDPTVGIENPFRATIELSTEVTGRIEPADVVYVVPKGMGEVLEVYAELGDSVEKGQELFKIDNKQFEAAQITLNQAEVQLSDAQTNLNRMKVLYESGDISAQQYEQTVKGVELARLQCQSAKLNYDIQKEGSVVTAPISGVLEQFNVKVHDMIGGGTFVAVISSEGSKSVRFAVTERVVGGLHVGDPLTVEKGGMEYNGVITEVGSMVDMQSGLFNVKATLEAAEGLATGTMVKLYVTSEKAEDVMTIPVDCVIYEQGDAFVYTYDEETGTAVKKAVEEGTIGSERVQIVSGLEYDDQVIVTWAKEIYDGAPVQIMGEESPETEAEETAAKEE